MTQKGACFHAHLTRLVALSCHPNGDAFSFSFLMNTNIEKRQLVKILDAYGVQHATHRNALLLYRAAAFCICSQASGCTQRDSGHTPAADPARQA